MIMVFLKFTGMLLVAQHPAFSLGYSTTEHCATALNGIIDEKISTEKV